MDDRTQIGLTAENVKRLEEIEARGWFQTGQDVARFCLSYAIRKGVEEGQTFGTETRWAAGNLDETGEIRVLLAVFYPNCKLPVRLMQHLINEGIRLVRERIDSTAVGPAELLD